MKKEAVTIEKTSVHYLKYVVKKEDSGQEIRSLLYENLKLTTRKIRALKQNPRGLLLNGEPATVRRIVREGDILKAMLDDSRDASAQTHILPVSMHLRILYEDEDLIFIDKPAGVVCHPSKGHLTDTLCNGVSGYYEKTGQNAGIHLFGRLDKDTSGIVGIAKNKVAAGRMQRLREQGLFQKEYLALVGGCPPEPSGTINLSMEEDRSEGFLKIRAGTGETAKKAVTHYETLRWFPGGEETVDSGEGDSDDGRPQTVRRGGVSLCRVLIETGRTHQIRFHMTSVGCPLLGDDLYGNGDRNGEKHREVVKQRTAGQIEEKIRTGNSGSEKEMKRTALHAWKVRFSHPFTGKEIIITAGLPEDMRWVIAAVKEPGEQKGKKSHETQEEQKIKKK